MEIPIIGGGGGDCASGPVHDGTAGSFASPIAVLHQLRALAHRASLRRPSDQAMGGGSSSGPAGASSEPPPWAHVQGALCKHLNEQIDTLYA